MSLVNILNVEVLGNPSSFNSPFQFNITFECLAPLEQDLEWKIIYVGSAESERYDQVLDSIMVGPVPVGINKFLFQADPPNSSLIPTSEIRGVTVILLICSYLSQEFIRVGYYVDNDYEDPLLRENPPDPIQLELLQRNILADKPRVTRFNIIWDPIKAKNGQEEVPQELLDIKVDEEENINWDEENDDDDENVNDDDEEEEEEEEENDEYDDGREGQRDVDEDDVGVQDDNDNEEQQGREEMEEIMEGENICEEHDTGHSENNDSFHSRSNKEKRIGKPQVQSPSPLSDIPLTSSQSVMDVDMDMNSKSLNGYNDENSVPTNNIAIHQHQQQGKDIMSKVLSSQTISPFQEKNSI